ncbi:hypothetical protein P152DRAFT_455945 [Eremomyces bilateralis CBS 781.70]|uniref:Uncharacterized protein n=1 Tax=Eremomyces bilateralis CBS 781.70 TaxID=1392243 RepID=A0A6G1GA52_9PEZI|nr:uncharacterized protein P152DRAFT_455945 [Eremomyces bilateralis CBS 781.70]KAF1814904.1 hypothetical protein P152DRAFT_455945 [Eremomyces bilateralis CBS 781.70]
MEHQSDVKLPRIVITYCTQCRWMLRAGYFAQELLTTFQTTIGEISLVPAMGGLFTVELTYLPSSKVNNDNIPSDAPRKVLIWDRKSEGGFPETKVLKQLVRNHIDPDKNLGHSDKKGHSAKSTESTSTGTTADTGATKPSDDVKDTGSSGQKDCEDCR